jgi:hypothetical protein
MLNSFIGKGCSYTFAHCNYVENAQMCKSPLRHDQAKQAYHIFLYFFVALFLFFFFPLPPETPFVFFDDPTHFIKLENRPSCCAGAGPGPGAGAVAALDDFDANVDAGAAVALDDFDANVDAGAALDDFPHPRFAGPVCAASAGAGVAMDENKVRAD